MRSQSERAERRHELWDSLPRSLGGPRNTASNLFVGTLGGLISTIALDAYKSWAKTQANPGPVAAVVAVLPSWLLPTVIFLLIIGVAIFAPPMLASSKVSSEKGEVRDEPVSSRERDEINDLKQKINGLRDDVYQANGARNEMRAERDAGKEELRGMTGERDYIEAQWKAHLRDVDKTTVPKNIIDCLVNERNALQRRLDGITPLVNFDG